MDIITQQLELFQQRLPRKPYCTDEKGALIIRTVAHAIGKKLIQPNPHCLRYWLTYDIDRPAGALAWEDGNVAPPTLTVTNPANGHAHLLYGVDVPIVTSEAGRAGPIRFAGALDVAYADALDADRGYSGLICKNPLHPYWRVDAPGGLYDLGELAEWVDLTQYSDRRRRLPEYGLGRNCTLFERLRHWAYRNVDTYRQGAPYEAWLLAVRDKAEGYNDFPAPLELAEVYATAKSVAKWTWRQYMGRMPDEQFSQVQAKRGALKGKTTREQGLDLIQADPTLSDAAIAEILGVDRSAVYRWRCAR